MSYEIIYLKQFIRIPKEGGDLFVPMVYGGSNNCIQFDKSNRGRRERSWFALTYILQGKRFGTLAEMLSNAEAERERIIQQNKVRNEDYKTKGQENYCDEYSDKRWGYFTSLSFGGGCKSTFGQYKGLFITGCKKALTVEELKEFGINVNIYSSIYSEEAVAKLKAAGKQSIYYNVQTSAELIDKLNEYEEYLKDAPYVSLYITIDADERDMKRIRREKFPTKKGKPVYKEVEKFFVVKDVVNSNYIIKATRNGYRYTFHGAIWAKKFGLEKAAQRWAKSLNEKYRAIDKFVVEEINEKANVLI
jgi:hypothetical protein